MAIEIAVASTGRPGAGLADLICARLVFQSMRAICSDPDMPSEPTVYAWLGKHPDFLKKYLEARVLQSHCMADIGANMAMNPEAIRDPAVANVQLKAIMWQQAGWHRRSTATS